MKRIKRILHGMQCRLIGTACRSCRWIVAGGAVALLLSAAGCISPHRVEVVDVDPSVWNEVMQLRMANVDTVGHYDLLLVVRYNAEFDGDPVGLELTTIAPDSLRLTEPVTLHLPSARGAAPLLRDTAVCYRRRVVLRREGEYRVMIRPLREVRGIEAVGISVEPTN